MMFWFGVAVLIAVPLVLLNRRARATTDPVDDRGALEAAEREVRDLDAFSSPEEAERDLPDWGPGAPR